MLLLVATQSKGVVMILPFNPKALIAGRIAMVPFDTKRVGTLNLSVKVDSTFRTNRPSFVN